MKNSHLLNRLSFALHGLRAAFHNEKSFRTQLLLAIAALIFFTLLQPGLMWGNDYHHDRPRAGRRAHKYSPGTSCRSFTPGTTPKNQTRQRLCSGGRTAPESGRHLRGFARYRLGTVLSHRLKIYFASMPSFSKRVTIRCCINGAKERPHCCPATIDSWPSFGITDVIFFPRGVA